FKLDALAFGGRNFTGVAESSPLAVFSQWSRPSLESAQTGREPPKPPAPPLAANESAGGGGGPAGPRPRPGPPPVFGLSIVMTVTPPLHGPDVSFTLGISDE